MRNLGSHEMSAHQFVQALVVLGGLGMALLDKLLSVLDHVVDSDLVVRNLAGHHLVLLQQQVHGLQARSNL